MKPPVGFIGLGLMGRPMAANLLKAGYELTVWNRTASRADTLVAQGAKRAATPSDVAAASEVIFTIVSDPPALESVLWGERACSRDCAVAACWLNRAQSRPSSKNALRRLRASKRR